jgi:hypothetical protein
METKSEMINAEFLFILMQSIHFRKLIARGGGLEGKYPGAEAGCRIVSEQLTVTDGKEITCFL